MAGVEKKARKRRRKLDKTTRRKLRANPRPPEREVFKAEDDVYAINIGQSEYREAFNTGDVERLLRVFAPGFVDMSERVPSFYDEDAPVVLRRRMTRLFEKFRAQLGQAVMTVQVFGETAYSFGLRQLTLEPKDGGPVRKANFRFFELWSKNEPGEWRLQMVMDNVEPPLALPEIELAMPWFRTEEVSDGG